jgi:hypothetical protein
VSVIENQDQVLSVDLRQSVREVIESPMLAIARLVPGVRLAGFGEASLNFMLLQAAAAFGAAAYASGFLKKLGERHAEKLDAHLKERLQKTLKRIAGDVNGARSKGLGVVYFWRTHRRPEEGPPTELLISVEMPPPRSRSSDRLSTDDVRDYLSLAHNLGPTSTSWPQISPHRRPLRPPSK